MDLRQLEYVVAIADTGGFTRAARRCHVAQSALSRRVAQLETELGADLFHRTTREVRLTGAGRAFIPAARRVLSEAAGARAAVDAAAGSYRGQVRLGATQTASGCLDLAELLGEFRRRFPGASVLVTAGPRQELLAAVADGELDIALAASGGTVGDLKFRALLTDEPLVAVVGRDDELALRKSVSLAEIAAHSPCVEFRPGTELRRRMDAEFLSRGLTRTIAYELGQLTEMVRFARAGLGTAVVPRSFTAGLAAPAGRTARILGLTDDLAITVGAYTRPDVTLAAARALLDLAVASPVPG